MDFSQAPITYILIALNVIFSIIGFSNNDFLTKTIGWPYYEKRNKEYYRLVTSGFLHADWMHLIFNMVTLYSFGPIVESIFKTAELGGSLSFLALYFLGLIIANIPSYIKHKDNENYRSLGASGAVSAVVFATILFNPWGRVYIPFKMSLALYAVLYIVYTVYMSKRNSDNIGHDAHLWGSIFGLAFTIALIAIFRVDLFPRIIEELQKFNLLGNS